MRNANNNCIQYTFGKTFRAFKTYCAEMDEPCAKINLHFSKIKCLD